MLTRLKDDQKSSVRRLESLKKWMEMSDGSSRSRRDAPNRSVVVVFVVLHFDLQKNSDSLPLLLLLDRGQTKNK